MPARRFAALTAVALAIAAGGCTTSSQDSSTSFKGDERQVANAIEDFQEAGARRDGDRICNEFLSDALVKRIKAASGKSCAKGVEDSLRDVDASELEVKDVTVTGSTATAKVESAQGKDDRVDTLQLVRERNRWRISELSS